MDLSLALGLLSAEINGLLLAIHAVMRPRSAQGAIAWSIALVFAPWVAVPFYLVFGRTRFQGYAEAVREKETQLDARIPDWYGRMAEQRADLRSESARMGAVVEQLTGVPFTCGNRVALLIDGKATYAAMLSAIAAARSYVLVQFYIVRDDASGLALRDALIERARAGIRVCFLYDEVGSFALGRDYLDALRREKIEVSGFRTTQGMLNRFQINFRNHRKLLVVDGHTGFIGGLNLGDEYLRYRDTHLRIDGPAAQQIQLTFRKDWFWATRKLLDVNEVPVPVGPEGQPGQAVSIVTTGPADPVPKCSILFSQLVASAAERVWIASPYFVPDDAMTRTLQAAAKRGVDVRVIVPDTSDHRFIELASLTYYAELMACGVRIFRYRERFLHHKVSLIDEALTTVGTVNLDYRSLYLNFEETALVADAALAREVGSMLEEDFRECSEVQRDHFAGLSLTVRVQARIARLASPLL
jgi:cardiolipin synthase